MSSHNHDYEYIKLAVVISLLIGLVFLGFII